jgi:hypothetical protein
VRPQNLFVNRRLLFESDRGHHPPDNSGNRCGTRVSWKCPNKLPRRSSPHADPSSEAIERQRHPPREMIGTHSQAVVFQHQNAGNTGGAAVPRPEKYHTEEERREAARQTYRKYYNTHREAIRARRAKRYKTKRAAMKAVRRET